MIETMMMKIAVFVFCALCLSLATAVPAARGGLSLRQSGSCSVNSDCYPSGINGSVPSRLIECDNNVCVCSECFTANTTGRCTFTIISPSDCYPYNSGTGTCTDNRKSQLVTFLLSLFLSGFGVANFYIGQNGLGAGQLVLTLSIIVVSCFAICVPICLCCCLQSDNEGAALCGGCLSACIIFLITMVILAASLAITAWWLADAIIFGLNERTDGNGCPLQKVF